MNSRGKEVFARYPASLLGVVMLVALFWVHLPNGFFLPNGIEYVLALLGANATLVVTGAGELSLDRYLEQV